MPVDVAGLEAMGISHEGGGEEYDDKDDDNNNSDADDTNLSPDGAIVFSAFCHYII